MGGVSMEWKEVRLGDICTRVCSGGTPKSTNLSYYGGEIPWLNTKEIDFNRIYSTEKTITDSGLNNSSAKWIVPNTVTVAMYGATAGKSCIVKVPMTTNQACCNLTINDEVADYEFVYYSLKNDYTTLASLANGGAQQNLNAQIIKDYVLKMPSLADQRRIASILSSLDRKIELNNKINADLEEMAQTIFKNWFVDFEPFKDGKFVDSELGMVPEGWKVGTLGDMGTIVCGKTPSKANSNYYGGDIPFIKIPDMHGNVFVENSEDRLTEEGSLSQIKKLIPPYSLMVSCIATVGLVSINTKPSHTNQQINTVIPHNKSALFYLYQHIKNNEEFLKNMGRGGTTTLNVNTKSFSNIRLLIPSEIALEQFHGIVEGLFKKIEQNLHESRTLSLLRDTLLPRLMSGELEVPE